MAARDGQHSEFDTKARVNVMPRLPSSRRTFGIASIESARWSSVRISTMFGRNVDARACSA